MAGAPASEGSPALSETSPRSSDESTLPGVFGLVDTAIARIEAVNPTLNAVIHERFERARAEGG